MPKSRHTSLMPSPSRRRATKRRRSCVTEHSFHGINTSRPKAKSVTHVSGTVCHLCLRPLTIIIRTLPAHVRLTCNSLELGEAWGKQSAGFDRAQVVLGGVLPRS